MSIEVTATPEWITSQRRHRGMCEQCGQHPATTEWATTGQPICRYCCEARQAEYAARLATYAPARVTRAAGTRRLTVNDAVAAAEVLRELDAGHEHAAYAVAVAYGLDGMVAEMLEHLCATFDVEV